MNVRQKFANRLDKPSDSYLCEVNEILDNTLFGNPLNEWLIALAWFGGSIVVSRVMHWISERMLKPLAARTASKLDDLLIDTLQEPVSFAIVIIGMWHGYDHLDFGVSVQAWMQKVFSILVTLNVTWLIVRFIDALIREVLIPYSERSKGTMDQVMPIIRTSIKVILWSLGLVSALNNAGYDVGAMLAGVGIGGLALALAAKDFAANIFGGITVFVDKPFKVGDRVIIAGFDGFVKEVGLRSTRLQTLAGRIVTIPNMKFTDSTVENITMEPSRRVKITVALTYGTTADRIREAEAILAEICEEHPFTEESYLIWFEEFAAYSLNVSMIYYIQKEGSVLGVQNEINLAILERFNAAGLDFAFPTQTVYHQQMAPHLPEGSNHGSN